MILIAYSNRSHRSSSRSLSVPTGDSFGRPGVLRPDHLIVPIDRYPIHGHSGLLGLMTSPGEAEHWINYAATYHGQTLSLEDVHIHPPIPDARKIICVGLNYPGHAKEQGLAAPTRPLFFAKAPTALIGANDDICLPSEECGADYEVELGVVIGRQGFCIPREQAMSYVAGYTVINDVSARIWQRDDGQWFRAKSRDTFCPCGPGIVPTSLIPHVEKLRLTTHVNDRLRQNDVAGHMRFDIPHLISELSKYITVEPGDIIATGSPAGSGGFETPPSYLRVGDVVRCSIEGIGTLVNRVVAGG